jgi:hypothetical protein
MMSNDGSLKCIKYQIPLVTQIILIELIIGILLIVIEPTYSFDWDACKLTHMVTRPQKYNN